MGDSDRIAELGSELHLAPRVCRGNDVGAARPHLFCLPAAKLVGALRIGELVRPRRPTAHPVRIGLDRLESGSPENLPRLFDDPLGMAQMAGILNGNRAVVGLDRRERSIGDQ